ncbi:MAG: DUF664 domain-containing protein [Williamsia herbipolensis]|nr:DUF664 domain-containing protein [Williamsia herbipolensis]
MATVAHVLTDAFERIRQTVHSAVDGLDEDQLAFRVDDDANSIAWLVWHLSRVQDDHVADLADREQRWIAGGWAEQFDLPFPEEAHGYGQSSADVAAVRVGADLLLDYYDEVHEHTLGYVRALHDADLDRVVDEAWDPPVTVGVRLMSVVNDDLQHAGQASFVRGVVLRRG